MAFEAVAGLIDWVAGAAVRTGWVWFRRAPAAEVLESLSEDGRAAFLELLVCAALDDGQISDAELAMLLRRASDVGRDEVETALDVAHDARPFEGEEDCRAFVAARADRLPNAKMRAGAFSACFAILAEANAPDLTNKAAVYGDGLGLSAGERERIQAEVLRVRKGGQ